MAAKGQRELGPWFSDHDIEAGQRWSAEIEEHLESAPIGIICVTPENQDSRWLNVEAGAISKKAGADRINRVVPYLLGFPKKEDLPQPLGQFQVKLADAKGTFELVQMINRIQPRPLETAELRELFDLLWPMLDATLRKVEGDGPPREVKRSAEDRLDELLSINRAVFRRLDHVGALMPREEEDRRLEIEWFSVQSLRAAAAGRLTEAKAAAEKAEAVMGGWTVVLGQAESRARDSAANLIRDARDSIIEKEVAARVEAETEAMLREGGLQEPGGPESFE